MAPVADNFKIPNYASQFHPETPYGVHHPACRCAASCLGALVPIVLADTNGDRQRRAARRPLSVALIRGGFRLNSSLQTITTLARSEYAFRPPRKLAAIEEARDYHLADAIRLY